MAIRDILQAVSLAGETESDISALAREVFLNETPILSRFPRVQTGAGSFDVVTYEARPFRGRTLGSAVADGGVTTITLNDNTDLLPGDVLEFVSGERVEVQTIVAGSTTQVTVTRGVEGTTAAAQASGSAVVLIANSRTGAEINQVGQRATRSSITQFIQTFMHPVQIGGRVAAIRNVQVPGGSVVENERAARLVEMVRDIEHSFLFGRGQTQANINDRPKARGLRFLIHPGNVTTSPTNASAYKPTDLLRDTVQRVVQNHGTPDILLVSTNFLTGFAAWGHAAQQIPAGSNRFGTPITLLEAPFLGYPINIIPHPLLPDFTAVCLSSSEISIRYIRQETWKPRGSRGDAIEADWLADFALDPGNVRKHAWVQGITAFSA